MNKLAKLNAFALTLLITGSIDSVRNLPMAAIFGSSLIFFFLFAAIFFLIPTAIVSAHLTANTPEGGIYQWVRLAFGERMGFLAVWLQWANNLAWYPAILSFIAGTGAYLINPQLAQNKFYLVSFILPAFWFLTLVNLRGVRLSAKFANFCAFFGLLIPMLLIIILMVVWLLLKNPIQIQLTTHQIIPNLSNPEHWIGLTAIMLSFTGMELATVHINDVKNPQRTFPKALASSTVLILATMMLGSLAIALVIPHEQMNLVNGAIQTFDYFLSAYHLKFLTPILIALLILGSLGGISNWIISPIKGLGQGAQHGLLPPFFRRENRYGVPYNLLLGQAIFVSFICLAFLFLPSVNGSYWLLSALTTQLYMLMYVLMFCAAFVLHKKYPASKNTFAIPFGKIGLWFVCLSGLAGCIITLIVGFIPPANINIGSAWLYQILFCSGLILMISPITLCYWYKSRQNKIIVPESLEKVLAK